MSWNKPPASHFGSIIQFSSRLYIKKTLADGQILYQNDVLRVYILDYGYQLVAKLDRLTKLLQQARRLFECGWIIQHVPSWTMEQ